jgi:hypothetical protein
MRRPFLTLVFFLLSCSSGSLVPGDAPESTSDFSVEVRQVEYPPVLRATSLDVKFEVTVRNQTAEPVTVEHIALESHNAGEYRVPFRSRPFHRKLGAGQEERFEFWARTDVGNPDVGTTAPLMLRTTLTVTGPEGKRVEYFIRNVNDWLGFATRRGV